MAKPTLAERREAVEKFTDTVEDIESALNELNEYGEIAGIDIANEHVILIKLIDTLSDKYNATEIELDTEEEESDADDD